MWVRWGEEETLEGIRAAKVEEEEAFEVNGADLLDDFVREGREGNREEVGRGGYSNFLQTVLCRKGVHVKWRGGCMCEDKREQRRGRADVRGEIDAIRFECGDARGQDRKAGRVVGAGEVVDCVENDIEYF